MIIVDGVKVREVVVGQALCGTGLDRVVLNRTDIEALYKLSLLQGGDKLTKWVTTLYSRLNYKE